MGQFHHLRPAVYGQFGPDTILDHAQHPPIVRRLHFVFDRPPADDLHASFPAFLVSRPLSERITAGGLSGASFEDVKAELDEQYLDRHPGTQTPDARLLRVSGRARTDDFGLDDEGHLIVSDAALTLLRQLRLGDCAVYDADHPPTADQVTEDLWAKARRVAEATRKARKRL